MGSVAAATSTGGQSNAHSNKIVIRFMIFSPHTCAQ